MAVKSLKGTICMTVGAYISFGGDYANSVDILRPPDRYFVVPVRIYRKALCQNYHPVS